MIFLFPRWDMLVPRRVASWRRNDCSWIIIKTHFIVTPVVGYLHTPFFYGILKAESSVCKGRISNLPYIYTKRRNYIIVSILGHHVWEAIRSNPSVCRGFQLLTHNRQWHPRAHLPTTPLLQQPPHEPQTRPPTGSDVQSHGFECVFIPSIRYEVPFDTDGEEAGAVLGTAAHLKAWLWVSLLLQSARWSSIICDTVYYVCSLAACQAATTEAPMAPARASDAAFGIIGSGMRSLRKFASSICEVPFDMDGGLGIFLEAGRLLLDYHAPTMHDDACMHACYTPWHVCSDLFWVVASLAKLTSELTHAHALRPPRNALEAPRFRRPGYFGTIDLLIRFNRALGSCHYCIHPFRSLASQRHSSIGCSLVWQWEA